MLITGAIRLCLICVAQNFGWGQALQQWCCLWLPTRVMAERDNISTAVNICHASYQSTSIAGFYTKLKSRKTEPENTSPLTLAIRHEPGSITPTSHPHITFPKRSI
jgi:hypothetical protein